ncbi:hypothetical protein [Tardiphaga sp. P9-11]|uniref:hypothetical protein n=1 Tax=Tardiphaga sp. P9-11 TaxID=2024614 RepID=UPI0011F2BE76|nr:hypothetical protein [Tardiphaga sp. P9-11]KAA0076087.1 hypothetical protein CIW50_07445 [Tardiphaga sp. P9-11]
MRNSSAATSVNDAPTTTRTAIGELLARRGVDLILSIEDQYALIQCQVSSAMAARMLAPLKGNAVGQFRVLSDNLVEIDASVTIAMGRRMLGARAAALGEGRRLH